MRSTKFGFVAAIAIAATMQYASATDRLIAGQFLQNTDEYIQSPLGKYKLVMQTDGHLVMYRSDGTIRQSFGANGKRAEVRPDGNFVLLRDVYVLWQTGTANCCLLSPFLMITDDGNLSLQTHLSDMQPRGAVWQLGPDPTPPPAGSFPEDRYPMTVLAPPGLPPSTKPAVPYRADMDDSMQYNMYPRR